VGCVRGELEGNVHTEIFGGMYDFVEKQEYVSKVSIRGRSAWENYSMYKYYNLVSLRYKDRETIIFESITRHRSS